MQNKFKSKVLAWVMTFMMIINMMPIAAFADDGVVDSDSISEAAQAIGDTLQNDDLSDVYPDDSAVNAEGNSGDADTQDQNGDQNNGQNDDQNAVGDTTTAVATPANDGDANANANANAVVGDDNAEYTGEEENGDPVVDDEQPVDDEPVVGDEQPVDDEPVVGDEQPVDDEQPAGDVPMVGVAAPLAADIPVVVDDTPKGELVFDTEDFVDESVNHIVYGSYDKVTLSASVTKWYNTEGVLEDLPEGTIVQFKWRTASGGQTMGTGLTSTTNSTTWDKSFSYFASDAGKKQCYYIEATAAIDGVAYTSNSKKWWYTLRMAPVSVQVTVNNKGVLASAKDGSIVNALTVDYVFDLNGDGKISVDEAMVAAHKQYMSESDYAAAKSGDYFMVSKVWGVETGNLLFYVDGKAITTSVDNAEVKKNNLIYVSINKDDKYYSDVYTKFDETSLDREPNEEFTLTLTDADGKAVSGATIGNWNKGKFTAFEGKTTDADGKVTLSLDAGNYTITAEGTVKGTVQDWSTGSAVDVPDFDRPIMPPCCIVNVAIPQGDIGKTEEDKVKWHMDSATGTLTISGTGATAGSNWKGDPWAARYKDKIKKLVVEEGVTALNLSFTTYPALEEVQLPASLTSTCSNGFKACNALKTITFAEGCKAELASYLFRDCTGLESVTLPATVTMGSGSGQFHGCTALKEATVGAVSSSMFKNCTALEKVTFVEGATTFGSYTFSGCTALTKVYVSASLKDFGVTPFPDVTKITFEGPGKDNFLFENGFIYSKDKTALYVAPADFEGEFVLPASVTKIGGECFENRSKLTKVTFAEGSKLEEIGIYAFNGCTSITEIVLPDTVKTVGDYAFQGCTELTNLTLSKNLESLGYAAVAKCAKITKLDLPNTLTKFGGAIGGTAIEEIVIPEKVTTIGDFASYSDQATALKRIVIKGPVTAMSSASYCPNLETLTLPATVTQVESYKIPYTTIKYIYFGGGYDVVKNWSLWKASNFQKNSTCTILCNYVEPTTENGKLEVSEYSADVMGDVNTIQNTTLSVKLKYPEGTTAKDGDKIWADWYYTTKTPDGLVNIKPLEDYSFDKETLTASVKLSEQAAAGATGSWYYICVVFKTDADGNTTMLECKPISALQLGAGFDFSGKGQEADPFVIDSYDKYVSLVKQVNSGAAFNDIWFKLDCDLTIKTDTLQMGNVNAFYANLDGGNHTVTYEKGAQPMFVTINGGIVRNLNIKGEYIGGAGLAKSVSGATIQNCNVLSGTTTKSAALAAAASNGAKFINCDIDDGVICGWDDENSLPVTSSMGSIACSGVGVTIVNCKSAATVYGGSNVGGLIGYQGTWSGIIKAQNSQFTGKVIASGEYAGGIMGRGYDNYTAPNARCSAIENCYVNADISGARAVGGIFGGEGGIDQCYDAASTSSIRNNVFIGKLELNGNEVTSSAGNAVPANNIDNTKGGIFGFMRSLNKYNYIENNFYFVTNDSEAKGFGAVEHVDTSAREFSGTTKEFTGEGDDTPLKYYENFMDVFYYDTSRDSVEAIKNFVDREDFGKGDWGYTSVINRNYNRTDDPLGADADKLVRAMTAEELTDGSIVKLLNDNANSMHNWVQGTNGPEISDKAVAYQLEIGGDYKTEYYIGDKLDMSGATFTATWTDGSTTDVSVDDVTFTGFDSSKRAVLTLTATYGNASTTFSVKVLQKSSSNGGSGSSTIKVYFTLLGDYKHEYEDDPTLIHTYKKGNLETWITKEAYTVDLNATVADLLKEVEKKHDDVSFSNPKGNWVDAVTYKGLTMTQLDNTDNSGWQYNVNKKHTELLVNEFFLNSGDSVIWYWTDDYTQDMGSEGYDNSGNQLGGGDDDSSSATETKYTVSDVKNLIDAIGTVTKDSKSAIEKARTAYDSLTAANQKKVTNYDKLTAAEAKYTELTGEKIEAVTAGDLPFSDVKSGAWYHDAIKAMYDKGLMNGESEKEFAPNNKLSRAMLVTILYRMQNEPSVTAKALFDDVAAGQWYSDAVAWAAANNIVGGIGDGKFAPNDSITRQELAAMMYRYAKAVGMDTTATATLDTFSDGAKVADWAVDAVKWAVGSGLIKGNDDGTINPLGTATRAEVATVIIRLLEMAK